MALTLAGAANSMTGIASASVTGKMSRSAPRWAALYRIINTSSRPLLAMLAPGVADDL
jgi:hypothetical protein